MTAPAMAHKESWYQARIIKWLKEAYPDAFVWKAAAGPYCRQGIPDICMVLNGRFYGFEVKRPEVGRLSKIQEQTIKEINAAGGSLLWFLTRRMWRGFWRTGRGKSQALGIFKKRRGIWSGNKRISEAAAKVERAGTTQPEKAVGTMRFKQKYDCPVRARRTCPQN